MVAGLPISSVTICIIYLITTGIYFGIDYGKNLVGTETDEIGVKDHVDVLISNMFFVNNKLKFLPKK